MIISASYKTDIPAFYGRWFLNRLRAGFCRTTSPYSSATYEVSLRPEDVDGFVFWTKNIQPFLPALEQVHALGFPFVVQFGINDYPRALERAVTDARRSVRHARHLCDTYGPRVVVWRYDTIVLSSLTPTETHLRRFEDLARLLRGATDECVISFAQIYRKTLKNMNAAARAEGFTWEDPSAEAKRSLAQRLAGIAGENGIRLTLCGQRELLIDGIDDARCIDPQRLSDIAGRPITARSKGHRADCGCCASRDIGAYDTCPHGCIYCYAVSDTARAAANYRRHDPESEYFFAPGPMTRQTPR